VGTDAPIIDRFDLDASPVLTLAVSGRRDLREVTELARKRVKEDLETINGVGAVTLIGGRERAINVFVDPERLLKYPNLSIEDVRQALIRENQEQPGGRVDQGRGEVVLRTLGRIENPKDFEKLIIANRNGQPIRIEDIGRVEDSIEEPRGISRLWVRSSNSPDQPLGDNAISLVVQKQSGSNTVEVVDKVKARLAKILPDLPEDLQVVIIRDQSRFIKSSIEEVKIHLVMAAILVSLTILWFMNDWRTMVIATTAIPCSMIGTFVFMYAMGFTLNNITLLGMILAIGIVIDDAVVVHENIFRFMEEKKVGPREAALEATSEIALAVVATTMSLLVIFIPVAFMGGRVGRFFSSFGFVVGFSLLASMFVSFTLTPMLCSRFLRATDDVAHGSKSGFLWRWTEKLYLWILEWSLDNRWVVVLGSIAIFASTPVIFGMIGKDFVPRDDQSEFEVAATLPEGYTLERADEVIGEIERRIREFYGVRETYTVIGETSGRVAKGQGDVTKATLYVRLQDLTEREFTPYISLGNLGWFSEIWKEGARHVGFGKLAYTQDEIQKETRKILEDYPDLRAFAGWMGRSANADYDQNGSGLVPGTPYFDCRPYHPRRTSGIDFGSGHPQRAWKSVPLVRGSARPKVAIRRKL